jgi:DNA repair exonuclease SbcCD ATPase subunit
VAQRDDAALRRPGGWTCLSRPRTTASTSVRKALVQAKDVTAATTEANALNHGVHSACKALQAAVDESVRKQLKADAKADTNLAEAKVKVGISVAFHAVIAVADVTRIGVSAGADVHAGASLFNQIMEIAEIVSDQLKKAKTLHAELRRAYDDYLKSRMRKEQAKKSKTAHVERVIDQMTRAWKSNAASAEEARKRFRDAVTSLRQNLEKLSKDSVKLEALVNAPDAKAKDLPKLREESKALKAKVDQLYRNITLYEQYLDNMSKNLAEAFKQHDSSTKVDDRTFSERFGNLDSVEDLGMYGSELLVIAGEIIHMGAG